MRCVKRQLRVRAALPEPCDSIPADPTDILVGSRVRRTRIFRDLTRRQLALRIGATERQVEAFESGETRIDADQVRLIGRVLAVRPSFFVQQSASDPWDAAEPTEPSPGREPPGFSLDGSAGERIKEIFESIINPRTRQLLVDLMLVITASEAGGRRLM